jgi:hypothetical protein
MKPDGAAGDPINILAGVDTDIAGDDGQKQMRGRSKGFDPHTLALEIENAVNPFAPEHFKAADMHGAEGGYRQPAIERGDEHGGEIRAEIDFAAGDRLGCVDGRRGVSDVADIGKALGPQQLIGDVLGGDADTGNLREAHGGRFEHPLGCWCRRSAQQDRATCRRHCGQKAAAGLHHRHRKPPPGNRPCRA